MPRDLILGTAGHIDHGKTSLVKALTGVDCDRLPEEKARGITIDIGFAHLTVGEFRLGIVDVPGHERFIKNMLAGATGVDLCCLVIAADDSIMPQTREHLEILQLLGLRHGVIALTKVDLVDETTREVVELEIRELVRGTFLESAPIIPTSAHTGQGIPELKAAIEATCVTAIGGSSPLSPLGGEGSGVRGSALASAYPLTPTLSPKGGEGEDKADSRLPFRLPIDRSFIVQGHGTVVTGSVTSGSVKVGEEVEWLPGGEHVRIRSLQNHDQAVDSVHRGMRAAINLAGVKHEDVIRGQELATPGYLAPSRVVTVRLHCLKDARPIKHRASVRFHVGTAELMGLVALLDCDRIPPGGWGLAQVFLEEPATTTWGQPFVVREPSATHTVGGGQVLQPVAPKIRRRHLEVLERIEQLWTGTPEERALVVAWFGGFKGFKPGDLVRGANVSPDEAEPLIARLAADGRLAQVPVSANRTMLLHGDLLRELDERIADVLRKLHEQFPLMASHDRQKVQARLDYVGDDSLVNAAVERLLQQKKLVGDQRRLALADHKPKLSAAQRKLKEKMIETYREARFQPPEVASFAPQAGGNAAALKDLVEVCIAEGYLSRVNEELFLHTDSETEMKRLVEQKLQEGKGLTVAEIRDLLGTTRKYAVPLCEHLDRIHVTRREGDLRFVAQKQTVTATG